MHTMKTNYNVCRQVYYLKSCQWQLQSAIICRLGANWHCSCNPLVVRSLSQCSASTNNNISSQMTKYCNGCVIGISVELTSMPTTLCHISGHYTSANWASCFIASVTDSDLHLRRAIDRSLVNHLPREVQIDQHCWLHRVCDRDLILSCYHTTIWHGVIGERLTSAKQTR